MLYTLGFLVLKRKELLQFFIFLIPISKGPLLYYLNMIFALMFLIKNIEYIKINRAVIVGFILVLWEALHLLPNSFSGYNESIIKLLGFALCLIVATIAISNDKLSKDYLSIIFSWCIGLASFCSILLIKYINNYGLSNFTTIVRRFGWLPASLDSTSTSLLINPNALGKLVILTVFSLLTVIKYEKKYTLKIIILIIYFFPFGLMTGSRSFLLVFTILFFVYLLEIIFNIRDNKKMGLVIMIISVLILFFATNYMESTLNMISKRMQTEDISGSRFEIYKLYIDALKNSPYIIFGSGMQDYNLKYNLTMSSHNFFIEVISIWGIIGLVIVFLWLISLYKSLKPNRNVNICGKSIIHYLPLLGLFLYAQTGQFFISYYDTLPTLILAFLNIKYVYRKLGKSN